MIETLSSSIDKEQLEYLLNQEDNGFTPLDQVNISNKLDDIKRLALTKFIWENHGRNTNFTCDQRAESSISRILCYAAKRGHIETFKHFILMEDPQNFHFHVHPAIEKSKTEIFEYMFEHHRNKLTIKGLQCKKP